MQQVASRLHLAGAPKIGRIDRGAERRSRYHLVVREDGPELEREDVERLLELGRGEHQGRRQPGIVPGGDARRAGAEIVVRGRFHDGQRVNRRGVAIVVRAAVVAVVLTMRVRALSVHHQRLQAWAEDAAQLALEGLNRRGNGHTSFYVDGSFGLPVSDSAIPRPAV